MALRYVYIGSVGPYIYDDADVLPGSLILQHGIWSDGPLQGDTVRSFSAPTVPTDCVRLADIPGGLPFSCLETPTSNWTICAADDGTDFTLTFTGGLGDVNFNGPGGDFYFNGDIHAGKTYLDSVTSRLCSVTDPLSLYYRAKDTIYQNTSGTLMMVVISGYLTA